MKVLLIVLTLCCASWCDVHPTIEKFFKRIGEYQFKNNNKDAVKSYYSSRNLTLSWTKAFVLCRTFGMDLVELPTAEEDDYFLKLCATKRKHLNGEFYHIGGSYVGVGMNEFYWMTTGQQIAYPLNYKKNEPNNFDNDEMFLTIYNEPESFTYNDMAFNRILPFICQNFKE
ncbi:unnamed protein product [Diamesa serratosioi]